MPTVPIAYIVFNRPRHTRETFAAIRSQRPAKLFIIADGPRPGHPTDAERCRAVREIVEQIDWPCEVNRNYAEQNLGCKQRVISGLNWVFERVERAIILEDDCLPHPDFFSFCDALLQRYKDDDRVMVVTGDNFQDGRRRGVGAYYFSKYTHVWGWATWRRAWQKNDPSLAFWPEWKKSASWIDRVPNEVERRYWSGIFDHMYRNEIDTWDYCWIACVWYHGGLTATPNVNLVTHIGLGPEATNTLAEKDAPGLATRELGTLIHPDRVEENRKADLYVWYHRFGGLNQRFDRRLLRLPGKVMGKVLKAVARRD